MSLKACLDVDDDQLPAAESLLWGNRGVNDVNGVKYVGVCKDFTLC
jgi:hypothetical protein